MMVMADDDDLDGDWWYQVSALLFAVQIGEGLRMTELGLGRAVSMIPYRLRRTIRSYQWAGEFYEDGQRWALIKVSPPQLPVRAREERVNDVHR
jgi:hypothetical protein